MWYVYILECSDGTFYTGITTDIEKRITEHNEGKSGAKYTRARRPVLLVYVIESADRSTATKEEMRIKKLSREEKFSLIENYKKM
jgi:putative endonuclease